jgi:hypothetical protein
MIQMNSEMSKLEKISLLLKKSGEGGLWALCSLCLSGWNGGGKNKIKITLCAPCLKKLVYNYGRAH